MAIDIGCQLDGIVGKCMGNPGDTQEPRHKPHHRYLFYRVYCILAVLGWNVSGLWVFSEMDRSPGDISATTLLTVVGVPFIVPAMFMIFNLLAFRWRYSVFGPYQRTEAPTGPSVANYRASWGMIFLIHGTIPFFSYSVYREGLGIAILGIGKCYLPYEDISRLKKGWWSWSIHHCSGEIRGPIVVPTAVGNLVSQHRSAIEGSGPARREVGRT